MSSTYQFNGILQYIPKILSAFPVTAVILVMSLLFSILIGGVVATGVLGKNKYVSMLARGYISFMRGIPTLVLIFLLYLGLPQVMKHIGVDMSQVNKVYYIIACLSLSASANMAELMRTCYLAVDKGQREAAYSVGMKRITAFRRIVFPQAFGIAIPTLGNHVIMLFKETSLAFTVGVLDLLGKGRAISAASYGANRLEVYIATGIIFWVICIILEYLSKWVERLYTKGRKQIAS